MFALSKSITKILCVFYSFFHYTTHYAIHLKVRAEPDPNVMKIFVCEMDMIFFYYTVYCFLDKKNGKFSFTIYIFFSVDFLWKGTTWMKKKVEEKIENLIKFYYKIHSCTMYIQFICWIDFGLYARLSIQILKIF